MGFYGLSKKWAKLVLPISLVQGRRNSFAFYFGNLRVCVALFDFCAVIFQGPPPGRSMDHGPGNFMGNQGRWTAMPGGPFRKGNTSLTETLGLSFAVVTNITLFSYWSYEVNFSSCSSRSWDGESRRDARGWAWLGKSPAAPNWSLPWTKEFPERVNYYHNFQLYCYTSELRVFGIYYELVYMYLPVFALFSQNWC